MNIINQKTYGKYNIFEYDVVDSTMNVIKTFQENTVIVAQKQESGKGKTGRVWNSENTGNLYFSIIKKTNKTNLDYSQLSFTSSIAMRQSIAKYANNHSIKFISKWPNDILINNKKCCGILLQFERSTNDIIIGIGVNINTYPETANFTATSLKNENIIANKYEILEEFLKNFDFLVSEWENQGFAPIREKWLKNCYKLNEKITVNNTDGIFKNIDKDGTLVIELNNGEFSYIKSGDVF